MRVVVSSWNDGEETNSELPFSSVCVCMTPPVRSIMKDPLLHLTALLPSHTPANRKNVYTCVCFFITLDPRETRVHTFCLQWNTNIHESRATMDGLYGLKSIKKIIGISVRHETTDTFLLKLCLHFSDFLLF